MLTALRFLLEDLFANGKQTTHSSYLLFNAETTIPIEFLDVFFRSDEITITIGFMIAVIGGFLIGAKRESRGKSAGINIYILVIAGFMMFRYLLANVDSNPISRIAAYVVAGIGFLGEGMIIRGDAKKIFNLTTVASILFAAAIDMAIGYEYYSLAILGIVLNVLGPRMPSITKKYPSNAKQNYSNG